MLPAGTPDDVRQAVRSTLDTLDAMSLDGGYVPGAVHNVQDDAQAVTYWPSEQADRQVNRRRRSARRG
ncbi:MAG: hypothetical protein M1546_05665 [Chloroflexi bacterium]|nr:hypothetical protein [Chloroflexota bacterium]